MSFNFMFNQLMLESMDDLKRKIFSGSNAEKKNEMYQASHEIYCEGQNVSDFVNKEEHEVVKIKEDKKKPFKANYNMFF